MNTPSASAAISSSAAFDRCYRVVAWNMLRLGLDDIASLRKAPDKFFSPNATPLPLKHSDHQTVAALASLFRAVDAWGLSQVDFNAWSVVAMPRFIGRAIVARTYERYNVDGAWGVSMQLVPHNMLHSQASTISLALGSHGPAIGAGGGVRGEHESTLAALGLLNRGAEDGLWMTWTGWEPEMVFDAQQQRLADTRVVALTIAIQGLSQPGDASRFRVCRDAPPREQSRDCSAAPEPCSIHPLTVVNRCCEIDARSLSLAFDLGGDLRLELDLRPPARVSSVPAPLGAAFGAVSFHPSS